jgi:hypothetical protein
MEQLNEQLSEQLTNIKAQGRARSNKYYHQNKFKIKQKRETKIRLKNEEKEKHFNVDEYLNKIKLNYGELSKIYILVYLILNYGMYENLYILDEKADETITETNNIKDVNYLIIPENKEHNIYILFNIKNEYGGKDIKLLNNCISDIIQRYKEQYNIRHHNYLFSNHNHLKEHVKHSNELLNIDMTLNNLLNIYKTNKLNRQLDTIKHIKTLLPNNYNVELLKPEEDETIILKPHTNIIYSVSEFKTNLKEAMKKDKINSSKIDKEFKRQLNTQQTNN